MTVHDALRANLSVPGELVDGSVDEVNDVLVSDVRDVGGIGQLCTERTCAVLYELTLSSNCHWPCSAAGDVSGDLLTVADERRPACALVDEARVPTVVDSVCCYEGDAHDALLRKGESRFRLVPLGRWEALAQSDQGDQSKELDQIHCVEGCPSVNWQ